MFTLLSINNMHVTASGFVAIDTEWARVFFALWYSYGVLMLLNIVTAVFVSQFTGYLFKLYIDSFKSTVISNSNSNYRSDNDGKNDKNIGNSDNYDDHDDCYVNNNYDNYNNSNSVSQTKRSSIIMDIDEALHYDDDIIDARDLTTLQAFDLNELRATKKKIMKSTKNNNNNATAYGSSNSNSNSAASRIDSCSSSSSVNAMVKEYRRNVLLYHNENAIDRKDHNNSNNSARHSARQVDNNNNSNIINNNNNRSSKTIMKDDNDVDDDTIDPYNDASLSFASLSSRLRRNSSVRDTLIEGVNLISKLFVLDEQHYLMSPSISKTDHMKAATLSSSSSVAVTNTTTPAVIAATTSIKASSTLDKTISNDRSNINDTVGLQQHYNDPFIRQRSSSTTPHISFTSRNSYRDSHQSKYQNNININNNITSSNSNNKNDHNNTLSAAASSDNIAIKSMQIDEHRHSRFQRQSRLKHIDFETKFDDDDNHDDDVSNDKININQAISSKKNSIISNYNNNDSNCSDSNSNKNNYSNSIKINYSNSNKSNNNTTSFHNNNINSNSYKNNNNNINFNDNNVRSILPKFEFSIFASKENRGRQLMMCI